MDKPIVDDYLPEGMVWWLGVKAVMGVVIGGFMVVYPELLTSPAYGLATDLFPMWLWGCVFAAAGVMSGVARLVRSWRLAVVSLGVSMWAQFIFGLSIFALTLSGTTSAVVGSVQWWVVAAVSAWFISRGHTYVE